MNGFLGDSAATDSATWRNRRFGAGYRVRREPLKAPPIATDVEQLLVWTYGQQQADLCLGTYDPWRALLGSDFSWMVQVQTACRLGALVDGDDLVARAAPVAVHDDAARVHGVVLDIVRAKLITVSVFHMLVQHARRRDRPSWCEGVTPSPLPVYVEGQGIKGRQVKVEYLDKGRRYGYCPIEWDGSAAYMEMTRKAYRAWHNGLCIVAGGLAEVGLETWAVTGPAAPAAPWLKGS
jgi:hypothetical protein